MANPGQADRGKGALLPGGAGVVTSKQGAQYTLRAATEADLDALHAIARSAHHSPWEREIFARELEVEFSMTWVIERGDDLDAPSLLGSLVFWRVHDELHILDIAVHRAAQGLGLGRALIEELAALGDDTQMSLITLEVRASNEPAKNLYDSCGFKRVGQRKGYYADSGEDAIIMTRILACEDLLL